MKLVGFGVFHVGRHRARPGHNPQTHEPMRISARRLPKFAAGKDLNTSWSVGWQLSGAWPTVADDHEFVLGATAVSGTSINEEWSTFFEITVEFSEESSAPLIVHHGYTILLGALHQLDLHAGLGLSDAAPDFFAGGGFSIRF